MAARKKDKGRPSKRTPEVEQRIVEAVRGGATRKAAAEYAGIHVDTFYEWLKEFSEFSDAVTRAEAECEVHYAAILKRAAQGHEVKTIRRTVTPVHKVRKKKLKSGTIIEEPVVLEEVKEETTVTWEYDWRAAESWLKRRRRADWGDSVNLDLDNEITDLLEKLAGAGQA